ncbi:MAG: TetR/AcrR family transcriptional regulator, partial [Acidimicrobiia bacterium]|nr:TetR/AcrR family transcriptional regulator [Acidimicrobiia bacterium]
KEAILDGVVDVIVAEINEALADDEARPVDDWASVLRSQILTARQVMLRHPWAPGVIEGRTDISPTLAFYYESVLRIMIEGGFTYDLAHHAMHTLGSRALGFNQELFQPDDMDQGEEDATEMMEQMAEQLPHLTGMMMEISHDDPESTLGWCDDQTEFEFGIDVILEGLERRRTNL